MNWKFGAIKHSGNEYLPPTPRFSGIGVLPSQCGNDISILEQRAVGERASRWLITEKISVVEIRGQRTGSY